MSNDPANAPTLETVAEDSPLPLLFLDGEALVVDKPAGMPVTPTKAGEQGIEQLAPDLRFGFRRPPEAVHRLDRDTSGCLLLARNPGALKRFGQAFAAREVHKLYLGIIAGAPQSESGCIDLPLDKVSSETLGWWMQPGDNGKAARTFWRCLATIQGNSLLAFVPLTGRTHQIRAHAYFGLGLPLLHDPVYRNGRTAKPEDSAAKGRTLLHSRHIAFTRPGKNAVSATASMPRDFVNLGFDEATLDQTVLDGLVLAAHDNG
ncbi:MAG: RNA pseudouridine synthase [Pseudomonadota bacterium]